MIYTYYTERVPHFLDFHGVYIAEVLNHLSRKEFKESISVYDI